jgi:splicing factor 3A subunit 2
MKNHLGSYECKLCLTIHIGEGSYLAHTQGKRHQENISRRGMFFAAFVLMFASEST